LIASHNGISASQSNATERKVNRRKIHQIVRTVETMLGWMRSERASLSYNVSEPLPGRASTAVVRTITPTSPIHSVNERHYCSVAGSTASLSVIVRPVPVKPLIDSKTLLSGFLKAARSYVVQRNREMTGDSAPE
jgi:hypothetical protein